MRKTKKLFSWLLAILLLTSLFPATALAATETASGNSVDVTFNETPIRGGIEVQKRDAETGKTTPSAGASFEGAVIQIVNKSAKSIQYNGTDYAHGEVVTTIMTNSAGLATTGAKALPYGTYELTEIAAPEGYSLNTTWKETVKIREDGKMYKLDGSHALKEEIWRGEIHFVKVNAFSMARVPNAPFRITNLDTGESHIVVTDINGEFSSTAYAHSSNTNGNDAAVSGSTVDPSLLDPTAGVWFSGGDTATTVRDASGAFPYGHYKMEELRCPANTGLELVTVEFEIYKENHQLDLGTIDDMAPYIETLMLDKISDLHLALANGTVTFRDKITYGCCIPGDTYRVVGVLMDRDANAPLTVGGSQITAEKTFVADNTTGSFNLEFSFDASGLAGKTVVAFVTLYKGSEVMYVSDNLYNADETIHFPTISTTAAGPAGEKELIASDTTTIIDTVQYENLIPGVAYVLKTTLIDKDTGNPLKDARGYTIKEETTFTPDDSFGSVEIPITFNAEGLEGISAVVFESLFRNGMEIAKHEDVDDAGQSFTVPYISTSLTADGGEKIVLGSGTITLTDTITYKDLTPGNTYTAKGKLMDKATGLPATDSSGNEIVGEQPFSPTSADGTVEVTFTFDTEGLLGSTLVAFENLQNEFGVVVAIHEDINDEDQAVKIPEARTSLTDRHGDKVVFANGTITLEDVITYANMLPGETYTFTGTLMDKDTGSELLDAAGNTITATKDVRITSADGSVKLSFTFDASGLEGKTAVAFEEISLGATVIAEHKDLDDEDQCVHFPKIRTTAAGASGEQEILSDAHTTITDTVYYENLIPGVPYVLKTVLVDKETGNPLKDAHGYAIKEETTFTPDSASGTINIPITFDSSIYNGLSAVVYETLYRNGIQVAAHEDIDDADQSFTIPSIGTTLTGDGGAKVILGTGTLTLTDTVTYHALTAGTDYTVKGKLMDTATGTPVLDKNGDEIVGEASFTAATADGTVDVTFSFDSEGLLGKTMVAFEQLYNDLDVVVAIHEDLDDEDQTVKIPDLKTTLTDTTGSKIIFAKGEVKLEDEISYTDLIPGLTYTFSGTLMDKATGAELLDAAGDPITASKTIKLTSAEGTVKLTFKFDASEMAGITAVAFEELSLDGVVIAEHKDIDDEDQSIHFPSIATTATDQFDAHIMEPAIVTEFKDVVHYENLIPGETYTMTGVVMQRSNGKVLKDDRADPYEVSVDFVPTDASGDVQLDFSIDARLLVDDGIVVFETLTYNGKTIAEHKELTDLDQTIFFPTISTTAHAYGDPTRQVIYLEHAEDTVKITDTVSFSNLIPGELYSLSATLMDKATGAPIKDEHGDAIVSTVTFTFDFAEPLPSPLPATGSGVVDVPFEVAKDLIEGKTLVCFETLLYGPNTIATHRDLEDEYQTVTVPYEQFFVKKDISSEEPLAGAIFKITDKGLTGSSELTDLLDVQTVTSDADGYVYFNALPGHQYSVIEVMAPDGYILDRSEHIINVAGNGVITGDTDFYNIHGGTIIITKIDVVTGSPVPGCKIAVFQIDAEGNRHQMFTQVTDDKGRIYFYTETAGEYMYKEIETVDGYYLNPDEMFFSIAEDLTVTGDTTLCNVPFGTVILLKVDGEGKPLHGATCAVYDERDNFLGSGITDNKGRVYFVSPGPGNYYFVETAAPKGYARDDAKYHFSIAADYTITGATTIINDRKSTTSRTGDTSNLALWIALGSLSVLALGGVVLIEGKKKRIPNN